MAGTNSAQWSFRHKIVDKHYYSASLGVLQFFFIFAVTAVRLCRDICVIRRNFSLNETKIVLWQENDWKVRFPEYESDTSKYTVYGKRSFLSKKSDTLRSYRVYISPTM